MSDSKTAYQVNQKIVYPSQGVGKITEIKEKKFKDQVLLYYVIYLEVSDMTVMIPVDRCDEMGIRAIVSPEEAEKALSMIGEEFEPVTSDFFMVPYPTATTSSNPMDDSAMVTPITDFPETDTF